MGEVLEGEIVEPSAANAAGLAVFVPTDNQVALVQVGDGISPNLMDMLLADKRSEHTKRRYRKAWSDFFKQSERLAPLYADNPALAAKTFCSWPPIEIASELAQYKNRMNDRKLAPATVNNQLAAVNSLLSWAFKWGHAKTDGRKLVDLERVTPYRDTKGIPAAMMAKLRKLPAKHFPDSPQRFRDDAVLRLLSDLGIRNDSLIQCNVEDFSLAEGTLKIIHKGYGNEKRTLTLPSSVSQSIEMYLRTNGHKGEKGSALFRSLDHRPEFNNSRLSNDGLRYLVGYYGDILGVHLRPHKLRHSNITALFDAGYSAEEIQKLTGHKKLETLMIYQDNWEDKQGELANFLSRALDGKIPFEKPETKRKRRL